MITKTALKTEYGFTDKAIEKFLGNADATKPNPHYKKMQMYLFAEERIERVLELHEFQEWKTKEASRRERLSIKAKARADQKRAELFAYIDSIPIAFAPSDYDALLKKAKKNYERHHDIYYVDWKSWPAEDLDRIMCNMLRHQYTNYEYELDQMFGKIGKAEGYFRLNDRIEEEIEKAYPFLA